LTTIIIVGIDNDYHGDLKPALCLPTHVLQLDRQLREQSVIARRWRFQPIGRSWKLTLAPMGMNAKVLTLNELKPAGQNFPNRGNI